MRAGLLQMQNNLRDKKQVAQEIHQSVRTVDNLVKARAIEFIKIGKSIRFSPDAIQRFKESRTVKAIA